MKPHVKHYLDYFGYGMDDVILCEICNCVATDVHHIERCGMGGGHKMLDEINNIMALCRDCHEEFGDKREHKKMLRDAHKRVMDNA